jgi:hypothetical protein
MKLCRFVDIDILITSSPSLYLDLTATSQDIPIELPSWQKRMKKRDEPGISPLKCRDFYARRQTLWT